MENDIGSAAMTELKLQRQKTFRSVRQKLEWQLETKLEKKSHEKYVINPVWLEALSGPLQLLQLQFIVQP